MWKTLKDLYQNSSDQRKLVLKDKLRRIKMEKGDTISTYLNKLTTCRHELGSVGLTTADDDMLSLLGLPKSWNNYQDSLNGREKLLDWERIVGLCYILSMTSPQAKTTSDEGGDVYLASSSTHVDHEAWLIDSGASFHFTPHREWFCEYEKYDGGDGFLGDDRKARIIGRRKVKLKLQGGRVRTLPGVLHIPALARDLISVSKLDDAGIKIAFEKDTCKMVRGALVLIQGVTSGTLYKLQGSTIIDGCNSFVVPQSGAENLVVSGERTMLWHQRLGHIGEKGL
eukprot:PITA_26746